MSNELYRRTLPNGVTIHCADMSRHYYGGFHHVSLEVECALDLAPEIVGSEELYTTASKALGNRASMRKTLSKMAVPSTEVDQVKQSLLDTFLCHNLHYLEKDDFPLKLIQSNLAKLKPARKSGFGR